MSPAKRPRCPHCGAPVAPIAENAYFPFCSKRCRLIDLGAWITEDYRIPGPPADVADDNPDLQDGGMRDDPPLLH